MNKLFGITIILLFVVLFASSVSASNITVSFWSNQSNSGGTFQIKSYVFNIFADTFNHFLKHASTGVGNNGMNMSVYSRDSDRAVQYITSNFSLYANGTDEYGQFGGATYAAFLDVCNSSSSCNQYPLLATTPISPLSCGTYGQLTVNRINITAVTIPGSDTRWNAKVRFVANDACENPIRAMRFNATVNDIFISNSTGGFISKVGSIVSLFNPPNADAISNLSVTLNVSVEPTDFDISNVTYYVWYPNSSIFNKTTLVLTGQTLNWSNISIYNLNVGSKIWNAQACGTNSSGTTCGFAPLNFTFTIGGTTSSNSYNTSTYETASETFLSNIVVPSGTTISSVNLYFGGASYPGTASLVSSTNYTLSKSIDIPTGTYGNSSWFWQINFGNGFQQNLSSNTQGIGAINLTLCQGAPQNIQYLNVSFKNETTLLTNVSASIISSWTYYLGGGTTNKTFSFSNTSQNFQYAFCFSPQNRSISALPNIQYYNVESVQRNYQPGVSSFSNSTTLTTLYLLPLSEGIYTRYKTVTSGGNIVIGVLGIVSKTIGGVVTQISSGYTDDSGQIVFFLNPNDVYSYSFSKTGYSTATFTLNPNSAETYTVTMNTGSSGLSNGTVILTNTSYSILPINETLLNNTVYTFGINASSSNAITFKELNITNMSGSQLLYVSGSGNGFISGTLDTGNVSTLIGYGRIETATENVTIVKVWTVGNFYTGDYSLFNQLSLFNRYGFNDFIRIILVISVIVGLMIYLSTNEILDTSESKILVVMFLVWAFSLVGWLDTGITVNSANANINTLGALSNKYGIAILTSVGSLALLLRRIG